METDSLSYISFDAKCSQFVVTPREGFRIYRTNPVELVYSEEVGNYKIAEIFDDSQIIVLVGAGDTPAYSPRRLIIWHFGQRRIICETSFKETIVAVKVNRWRIIVVTQEKIYIYDTMTMKVKMKLSTINNVRGLVALSNN